jgi:hypothetical protein
VRFKIVGPIVALLMVSFAFEACTDDGGDTQQQAAEQKAERQQEIDDALVLCADDLEPLLASMTELNSRLAVGVQFPDYLDRLGDVRVEYDKVAAEGLDPICLKKVGRPAEKALNIYADAAQEWSDCIQDFDCDVDSLNLSGKWVRAGLLVDAAELQLP